ncbi:MAG: VOC family protein [Coriobacteriales bacterium]|jgi:catechol 2,3-dioxygenase-like lactoylglutathione lyase family enzyme|nr:VOC family protein [Coriobacteriales bacterium]
MDLTVSHYDVHCDDLTEATRFYTEVLGFDCLFATPPHDEAPLDLVWLANDNGVVIELTHEKSSYAAEAQNRASLTHIALRTPDLDEAVAWLKSQGVEFEVEPREIVLPLDRPLPEKHRHAFASDGTTLPLRVSFFRGPSGERFELLEELG